MTAQPGRAAANAAFEELASQINENGWCSPHVIAQVRSVLTRTHLPSEGPAARRIMMRALIEGNAITALQANELDNLSKQQVHFPAYRLIRELGAGGMGTVYLVVHLATQRTLALKTIIPRLQMDADFVGRFQRESKVLIGLKHVNIAEIVESGDSDGACYMAMEYINGPSLATLLREHRVFPELYVLRICRQVADGLAYVYERSELVHRDIKPENILIQRTASEKDKGAPDPFPYDDVAKLIDFGLVKPVDDNERLTQTGMTIGTPLYMSPEQIRGEKIDCRSDIYGLCATMYHLLTGVTPFSGSSPGAIMSAHLTQEVPDPGVRVPSLHQNTRNLVMMGMTKNAADRFLTFAGLCKALDEAISLLDDKQSQAPRLLRKPLVLKGPIRKVPDKAASAADPAMPGSAGGPPAGEVVGDRIVRKFRENQDSLKPQGPGSPLLPVLTTIPGDRGEPPAPPSDESSRSRRALGAERPHPTVDSSTALRQATTTYLRAKRAQEAAASSTPAALAPGVAAGPGQGSRISPGVVSGALPSGPPGTGSGGHQEIDKRIAASVLASSSSSGSGESPFQAPLKSSVFDEDPERKIGMGVVPWVVFGIAVLAGMVFLLVYLRS